LTDQSRVGTSSNNSSETKFVTESWKANEVRLEAVAPATPQSLTGERRSSATVVGPQAVVENMSATSLTGERRSSATVVGPQAVVENMSATTYATTSAIASAATTLVSTEPTTENPGKTSMSEMNVEFAELESLDHIRQAQMCDDTIKDLLKWRIECSVRPDWGAVSALPDEVRTLWAQWDTLTVKEGILYRRFCTPTGETKYLQLIVPDSLRRDFVQRAHGGLTGGHFGIRRTQDQVQRRAYWVGWRRFVERQCQQCDVCSRVHRGQPPKQGKLKPLLANGPMDRLHIDLCGPFPRSNGFTWILTCIDAFTRYLTAVPLKEKTAKVVARALMENVFCKLGMARQIVSDLGPEFQNSILRSLCAQLQVNKLRTTS
jgi:Integrase zinc binding domain/Integrase core domain